MFVECRQASIDRFAQFLGLVCRRTFITLAANPAKRLAGRCEMPEAEQIGAALHRIADTLQSFDVATVTELHHTIAPAAAVGDEVCRQGLALLSADETIELIQYDPIQDRRLAPRVGRADSVGGCDGVDDGEESFRIDRLGEEIVHTH